MPALRIVLSVKEFPCAEARWAGVLPLTSSDDMLTPLFTRAYGKLTENKVT